jgi:alcohol dehydrogenase
MNTMPATSDAGIKRTTLIAKPPERRIIESAAGTAVQPFDFRPRTRVVFRNGAIASLGALAKELGFTKTLIVADPGIVAARLVDRAAASLAEAGIDTVGFHDFDANPDGAMVESGRACGARHDVDSITAIGGGSSLDCAKGINFVLTNGGTLRDYRGYGKATRPMLPMIGVPTTAGTGSDAQSYAVLSDATTHEKMACGDPGAAFRAVVLDPELTTSMPRDVTAIAGLDALSHAVESFVTSRRSSMSTLFAREAWRLLERHYERVLERPDDLDARGAMLVGAHYAGMAIEQSMLGATHACANPLTARYGTTHGVAIAVMLPHVVRWNATHADYAPLIDVALSGAVADAGAQLAARLDGLARAGGLPARLRDLGVVAADIPALSSAAAQQWTGTFNPRPFDASGARELYELAY